MTAGAGGGCEVSLAALTMLDAGPAGQIDAAAAAGFDAVGLRLKPLLETDFVTIGNATAEQAVRDRLTATGVGVLEIGVVTIEPDFDVTVLAPLMDFSAEIGARFLVSPVSDPDPARRAGALAALAEAAQPYGLTPLIEFNPYSACRSLADAAALIKVAGHENIGLCIDAFHLSRSGGHPRDLIPLRQDLLRLLHFCDAAPIESGPRSDEDIRAESRTGRLLPGDGALWLDELLGALPADIPISVEAPSVVLAGLPAAERAMLALAKTRAVLAKDHKRLR